MGLEEVGKEIGIGYSTAYAWVSSVIPIRKPDGGKNKKTFKVKDSVQNDLRTKYSTGKYSRDEIGQMFNLTTKVVYRLTKDIKLCRNRKGRLLK